MNTLTKINITLGILILIVLSAVFYLGITHKYSESIRTEQPQELKVYTGAVPDGYDLEHFRRTGETIPLK